jgi:hypothetical protein
MTTTTKIKSYACEVLAQGKWVGNGLRFATSEEAQQYGADLLSRWTMPDEARVAPSEEPVNYTFANGRAQPIASAL